MTGNSVHAMNVGLDLLLGWYGLKWLNSDWVDGGSLSFWQQGNSDNGTIPSHACYRRLQMRRD